MFKRFFGFLREVRSELKLVTWPRRRKLTEFTGIVIVVVLLVAAYLGILDAVLQQIMLWLH